MDGEDKRGLQTQPHTRSHTCSTACLCRTRCSTFHPYPPLPPHTPAALLACPGGCAAGRGRGSPARVEEGGWGGEGGVECGSQCVTHHNGMPLYHASRHAQPVRPPTTHICGYADMPLALHTRPPYTPALPMPSHLGHVQPCRLNGARPNLLRCRTGRNGSGAIYCECCLPPLNGARPKLHGCRARGQGIRGDEAQAPCPTA